jgi:hypothetical protein
MNQPYMINDQMIKRRAIGYESFWGRVPDVVGHQTDEEVPHIDVYRLPKVQANVPMGNALVYITGGMSDLPMPNTEDLEDALRYIEVTAYANHPIMTDSGKADFVAWLLHWLAHYPFRQTTYFLPRQTFDWGGPIIPGSHMEGFYFANTPFVDRGALAQASVTAKAFVHVIPITRAEIDLKLAKGSESLVGLFGKKRIEPFFDLNRQSMC